MNSTLTLARRWPLVSYFGLAFGLTWALLPFARTSVAVGLVALFGPAASGLVNAGILGRDELNELRSRLTTWRVPAGWYALAFLLPLPISALASGLEHLMGARGTLQIQSTSALGVLLFFLVIGEEIGWRGFALPRLLARFGPWSASAVLGVFWAVWHLPLFFIPGMPQFGHPFTAFVGYTIALSILLTFLSQHTRGSVVIATLFHGAVNTFVVVNDAAGSTLKGWGDALAYGVAALVIGAAAWSRPGASGRGPGDADRWPSRQRLPTRSSREPLEHSRDMKAIAAQ